MDAKEISMFRFLDGADKKFVIPVYQRAYSWKRENCESLLKDLMSVYEHNYVSHFFGSIVYVSNDVGGCNEHIIIDGQQRITTVSLLLLAIRNYIIGHPDVDTGVNPRKITDAYLTDVYADSEKKLKLKLIQGDDEAYDRLIENAEPIANNNITANYNYLFKEISKRNAQEIKGLYDAIMKLIIVNISLKPQDGDDPQLIFESLNSTGLGLDESDKIRNYVLMGMPAAKQESFYKKYWEALEKLVPHNDMKIFIRYYLAVKTRDLFREDRLYFGFKNFRTHQVCTIEETFEDILLYAGFYKTIRQPMKKRNDYEAVLVRINKLEINSCTPILLELFIAHKQRQLTDAELTEAFCTLESYMARRIICGLGTQYYNKLFVSLGAEIEKLLEKDGTAYIDAFKFALLNKMGKSRFPNDHDFADKFMFFDLYNAKASVRKYFFERLENFGNREMVAVEEQISDGTLTIEHVMPQTLTEEWKRELGEQWELVHSKYIDTVGNLTLTAYNSDYSNLSFTKKKTLPEKGFQVSKLRLNDYIKSCMTWGEQEILERARELYKLAERIWPMAETDYDSQEEDKWICWDDEDYDFTNKTILKIVLLGDELQTENITDAYRKVNVTVYNMDPAGYAAMENSWSGADAGRLRSPYKIGPSVYITTNLSSQSKAAAIRELCEYFRFDSSDLRYLVKATFDINNEATYNTVTAGQLAYRLVEKLLSEGKLAEEEVELLKEKEFSRRTFYKVVYPVLANNREDNKGKGRKCRYYSKPVQFKGKNVYISTEWFDESRKDLIEWYKRHL